MIGRLRTIRTIGRPGVLEGFATSANPRPHMNPTDKEGQAEHGQVPDKPIGNSGRTTTIKAKMLTCQQCQQRAAMRSWELRDVWINYVFVLVVLCPFAKRGFRITSPISAPRFQNRDFRTMISRVRTSRLLLVGYCEIESTVKIRSRESLSRWN